MEVWNNGSALPRELVHKIPTTCSKRALNPDWRGETVPLTKQDQKSSLIWGVRKATVLRGNTMHEKSTKKIPATWVRQLRNLLRQVLQLSDLKHLGWLVTVIGCSQISIATPLFKPRLQDLRRDPVILTKQQSYALRRGNRLKITQCSSNTVVKYGCKKICNLLQVCHGF